MQRACDLVQVAGQLRFVLFVEWCTASGPDQGDNTNCLVAVAPQRHTFLDTIGAFLGVHIAFAECLHLQPLRIVRECLCFAGRKYLCQAAIIRQCEPEMRLVAIKDRRKRTRSKAGGALIVVGGVDSGDRDVEQVAAAIHIALPGMIGQVIDRQVPQASHCQQSADAACVEMVHQKHAINLIADMVRACWMLVYDAC